MPRYRDIQTGEILKQEQFDVLPQFPQQQEITTPESVFPLTTPQDRTTKGVLGFLGKVTGVEPIGRFLGSQAVKLTKEGRELERLRKTGQVSEEEYKGITTGGVTGRQLLGGALQTGLTVGTLGAGGFLASGGKLLPQIAKSAALGGAFGGAHGLQEDKPLSDIKGDIIAGAILGGSLPIVGRVFKTLFKGVKGFPERLYGQIFKRAEDDLAAQWNTEALQNMQTTNPAQFAQFVKNGIIKTSAGKIEVNPTLAREALQRGLQGNSQNMFKYSAVKELELETQARQFASPETLLKVGNKKGYINMLRDLVGEFKKNNYGFFPERMQNAQELIGRLNNTKGNVVDAETALWLRRFLDSMRKTTSFTNPSAPLSNKQEAFREAANSLRSSLSDQIPGIRGVMNEYRFFIEASEAILKDAVRRENRQLIGLADYIAGGGGLVAGAPGTGISLGLGIRAFQQPSTLTGLAQGVYRGVTQPIESFDKSQVGRFLGRNLGNIPGTTGIIGSQETRRRLFGQ